MVLSANKTVWRKEKRKKAGRRKGTPSIQRKFKITTFLSSEIMGRKGSNILWQFPSYKWLAFQVSRQPFGNQNYFLKKHYYAW